MILSCDVRLHKGSLSRKILSKSWLLGFRTSKGYGYSCELEIWGITEHQENNFYSRSDPAFLKACFNMGSSVLVKAASKLAA